MRSPGAEVARAVSCASEPCLGTSVLESTVEYAAVLGSTILEVAIGVVFVFLLVSLLVSAMREGLETWLKTRASHLEAGLREVLRDREGTGLVKQFYNHPLIYSLYSGDYVPRPARKESSLLIARGRNLPPYIPSSSFALALMDMAARGPEPTATAAQPLTLETIRTNVGLIEDPAIQRALLIAVDHADGDLQQLQMNLEAWYNSAMDRVSGWYKRSSQVILLLLGLAMAVALNINAIHIGVVLSRDSTARELIVASAQKSAASGLTNYKAASDQLQGLGTLVGWSAGWRTELKENGASDVAGWLLTAFAVSFGAPFWFDLLNRLIVVRSTVKPHQKSPEEGSADRGTDDSDSVPSTPPPFASGLPLAPGPSTGIVPALPVFASGASALDTGNDLDGCDVDMSQSITADEKLPAATGGVRLCRTH